VITRVGKGFKRNGRPLLLPKRWVVERSGCDQPPFAWFEGYRRLSKDYERRVENSETMVKLAMIRLILNRVA
jgi:putative transposase